MIIASRYCGPPTSGNGGYSCGIVGSVLGSSAEVTLRSPPPLDVELELARTEGGLELRAGDVLVAQARSAELVIEAPAAPTLEQAQRATERFPWYRGHPYPTCFVCGPERAHGDGLCIHPGAVDARDLAAAPFVPDASLVDEHGVLRPEIAWAALDCPSWFGFRCFNPFDGVILLGRLTARIDSLPREGDECIVTGWSIGRDGRKIHCGSALHARDGSLLAAAQATWIVLM